MRPRAAARASTSRERHAAAHSLREDAAHVARQRRLGDAGLLEIHDVLVLAEGGADQRDRRHRRARQVRRVDADHARDARGCSSGIVHTTRPPQSWPDEDGLLDAERVEQADQIAGQVMDVVGLDLRRPVAVAVAALVGRDGAEAGRGERRHLMAPRVGQLGEAVAEDDGRPAPSSCTARRMPLVVTVRLVKPAMARACRTRPPFEQRAWRQRR